MRQIKFSHKYNKLNNIDVSNPVELIDVEYRTLESFSKEFLEYDTTYIVNDSKKNYPLKDGRYLLLYFMDCNGSLFTTIRRETLTKAEYYISSIGKDFEVVINIK